MTKEEKLHLSRVADLGCLICNRPAEIHHIRSQIGMGRRASNFEVLPLCETHHRTGGHGIAFHAGRKTWEQKYGYERDLLDKVKNMLDTAIQ